MRDPKRIKRILSLIETIWNEFPDQRIGQLMRNYGFGEAANPIFNIEDEITEAYLKKSVKDWVPKTKKEKELKRKHSGFKGFEKQINEIKGELK